MPDVGISAPTAKVLEALKALPPAESIPEPERMVLHAALEKASLAAEPAWMASNRMALSFTVLPVLRVALGMGLFGAFEKSGYKDLTLDELVPMTKGDRLLVQRVARFLCALHVLEEIGKDSYRPLALAKLYAPDGARAGAIAHFYFASRSFAYLKEFFEAKGYQTPGDAHDAPLQMGFGIQEHVFEYISAHPDEQESFDRAMSLNKENRGESWFDFFPVTEKFGGNAKGRPLIVDIGGNTGVDVSDFRRAYPDLPGKMVLADLPSVIDDIKSPLPAGVEAIRYDMFTPQPVRGARAYYLRTVLHDFPERQAVQILGRIREAMAEDSMLLINENTIPEVGAPLPSLQYDMIMMASFAALERTEEQWRQLLESNGFRLVKVWRPKVHNVERHALFEAVLQ